MIALLDIDSLFYLSCYKLDTPETIERLKIQDLDRDELVFKLSEIAEDRLWEMVSGIMFDIQNDENNIVIDSVETYVTRCKESVRKKISKEYKANRKPDEVVNCLRNMFLFSSDAVYDDTLEADDLIADRAKELGEDNCIIITMDKDLKQIGGLIYNYYRKPSKKDETGKVIESYDRKGLEYVSPINAMKFLAKQMLMGDSGDRIKGLDKYGIKKAEKIIEPIDSKFGLIRAVLKEYKLVHGDEYSESLMLNFRLLYLGRM